MAFFHCEICTGCTPYSCPNSLTVFNPRIASRPTLALNSGEKPVRRSGAARRLKFFVTSTKAEEDIARAKNPEKRRSTGYAHFELAIQLQSNDFFHSGGNLNSFIQFVTSLAFMGWEMA